MSGGVDSSVVAGLLHEQGYDLIGVTMHLWDAGENERVGRCCAPEDRDDARRVCDYLGIAHYVVDEREAFLNEVVNPFVNQYVAGRTPTPCVSCNQHVKLEKLVKLADLWGATHIATGHYARLLVDDEGQPRLFAGVDTGKDQSYFLFGVGPATLKRLLFPLGALTKEQTRAEGKRLGIANYNKPDSQQLCFVPDGQVGAFVAKRATTSAGHFVDEAGQVLGVHPGVHHFTVGQRKGLGLPGGKKHYVLRIVQGTSDVVLGEEDALLASRLEAEQATWLRDGFLDEPFWADVRVRYRHQAARARVVPKADGFSVEFSEPQRSIAPGQAAVVYRDQEVVAGGYIC